jgi:hypothetical protein
VRQRYVDLVVARRRGRWCYLRAGGCAGLRDTLHAAASSRSRRRCCRCCTAARPRGRSSPTQRLRHRPLPAHRAGAVPQAPGRRRHRAGVRDQPQLPQRGRDSTHSPSSRCSSSTRPTPTTTRCAADPRAGAGGRHASRRRARSRRLGPTARRRSSTSGQPWRADDPHALGVRGGRRGGHAWTRRSSGCATRRARRAGSRSASVGKLLEELFEQHVEQAPHCSDTFVPGLPKEDTSPLVRATGTTRGWPRSGTWSTSTATSRAPATPSWSTRSPAPSADRAVAAQGRRGRGGHAARRGLPAGAGARHAATGGVGVGIDRLS